MSIRRFGRPSGSAEAIDRQQRTRRIQRPDLRYDAARRRAVAGHLAEHVGEARDRAAARAPGRGRDRGRLPDHLARRLRGGAEDRARGRAAPSIAGLARTPRADIDAAWEAVRDAERPRIHTFISTSDIHIVHQLQTTREDVKGQARAAVAHAQAVPGRRRVLADGRDALGRGVHGRGGADRDRRGRDHDQHPGHRRLHDAARVRRRMLARLYELVPDLRGVVLSVHCHDDLGLAVANSFAGVLAGARQVECAVNGIGERAGNASLEEIVMLLRTRRADIGLRHGRRTRTRAGAHEPAGLAPDRLPGAAEQGDRRAQRVRARVGHPPGRRAEGAHDVRDHGRDAASVSRPTRSCWASTPVATRCARRSRSWASTSRARR